MLLAAACAPACAEPPPPPSPPAAPVARCTFAVRDHPLESTLRYVRLAAGAEVFVGLAPEFADARVTLKVRERPWDRALEDLARAAGGAVVAVPGGFRIGMAAGHCTFAFEDAAIEDALEPVRQAAGAGVALAVAPRFAGARVTVRVPPMPWRRALDAIAASAGCRVLESPGGFTLGRPDSMEIETLALLVAECRAAGEGYRQADQPTGRDFLLLATAKRRLRLGLERLEERLAELARDPPEFKDAGIQERYLREVRAPAEKIREEFADLLE